MLNLIATILFKYYINKKDYEVIEMRYSSRKTYDDFDYDNDVYERYDNGYDTYTYSSYNYSQDEDFQDEESSEFKEQTDKIDDDLADYFSDARVGVKPKNNKKKKNVKQKRVIFSSGDIVNIKRLGQEFKASIIYGPYEVDKKQMYEVEINGGEIIEIGEKFIQGKVE